MFKPTRRQLIAGLAVPVVSRALRGQNASASVEVQANVEIGTIRPELHGHFAEHLGSCTYGGLWVGKESPIPNVNGHRKQAVDWLKQVGIPVLRWPGGCFADDYHWRDGVGAREKRPKTVNIHWGNYTEDNSFGTHEFIELCRLIGAEPYLAANLGSGSPQEMRDWIEYCNYPSGSTLSDERSKNGSAEPFKVRYWGIGNENWACGGDMHPEEYCALYRQFSTYVRPFGGTRPFKIACGPNGNNTEWTRRFFDALRGKRGPEGFAMHFYSNSRSLSTKFDNAAAEEQLSSFQRIERAVVQQRALLDSYDPERRIGLLVDEWGVWDRMDPEEEKKYGRLFQQITMRSAVAAALGLNVFHRQAEKLVMCNIAQIVNVLHSLILTDGPKACRTTTYWAFDMLKAHRNRMAVRVANADATALALSVSASRHPNELVVTLVNPKPAQALDVTCAISGANATSATATILNHANLNVANTLDQPDLIMPKPAAVNLAAGKLTMTLPALSIATVTVKLA